MTASRAILRAGQPTRSYDCKTASWMTHRASRPVRPITTHGARQFCNGTVTDVPKGEIADAIQAGIAAVGQ